MIWWFSCGVERGTLAQNMGPEGTHLLLLPRVGVGWGGMPGVARQLHGRRVPLPQLSLERRQLRRQLVLLLLLLRERRRLLMWRLLLRLLLLLQQQRNDR